MPAAISPGLVMGIIHKINQIRFWRVFTFPSRKCVLLGHLRLNKHLASFSVLLYLIFNVSYYTTGNRLSQPKQTNVLGTEWRLPDQQLMRRR